MADFNLLTRTDRTASTEDTYFYTVTAGVEGKTQRQIIGGASLAYFVNLLVGDVGDPELDRLFAAINDNGVTGYTRTKGEDLYFFTYQQSRTDNTDIEQRFYKVKITDDTVGGSAGTQLTAADLQPSGSLTTNLTDQPSLEIDLGDIGATAVHTAFNADGSEPFTIAGLQFVTALSNSVESAWLWVGGDGNFGATGSTRAAIAADFTLLGASEIPLSETTPVAGGGGFAPDTIVKLDNWEGREYFMGAASAITTFTYSDQTLGGKARHLINAASEPVITGATKVNGDTFQASTNMYMHTKWNGTRAEYRFEAISVGSGYPTTVLQKKVTLSAAQVKTLNSSPVELVAAPGSSKFIRVTDCVSRLNWGSVAFDNSNFFITTNNVSKSQWQATSTFLNYTADSFIPLIRTGGGTSGSLHLNENAALIVKTSADSTATGDSTFDIYFSYEIIDL
tara:strand:- start:399 stop:1751 length:1353 start_codon:yes stop_codon:yes gene_type:complete